MDDDDAIRRLLARILTLRGLPVIVAGARRAAERELARAPALLLTDLDLGRGEETAGLTLIAQAARMDPPVPAVLITAAATPETRARAVDLGAAVVAKPFAAADLLRAVAGALGDP
ncbi:MAG TPA: response regulator [Thermoanaerobaculia bacterium]|nr:response regulator [Thermoanaerobaculia bacterium]